MVADEGRTVLSVRGEASVTVVPDQALISGTITGLAETKAAAVDLVSSQLASLTAELTNLGGVALAAQTRQAPLAWSATSLNTHAEHDHNKLTGQNGPTGRHQANISVNVSVRDFALLDRVAAFIAAYDSFETHAVQWLIDDDNPQWAQVRADANPSGVAQRPGLRDRSRRNGRQRRARRRRGPSRR